MSVITQEEQDELIARLDQGEFENQILDEEVNPGSRRVYFDANDISFLGYIPIADQIHIIHPGFYMILKSGIPLLLDEEIFNEIQDSMDRETTKGIVDELF